jgi:hypothetical protein
MRQRLGLWPQYGLLLALAGTPVAAHDRADPGDSSITCVQLTYRGGPLIQHAQVSNLFWGSSWRGNPLAGYLNRFFPALFLDGRYMANLAQYSAGGYSIGNGTFGGSSIIEQDPPPVVEDSRIRSEIRAQIAAQQLPRPTRDSLYFVFTAPHTVVIDRHGSRSDKEFTAYNDSSSESDRFAYVVIPYDCSLQDPRGMTLHASGALAAAVTNPEPTSDKTMGWYDDNYGPVEAIPLTLFNANRLGPSDLVDTLVTPDGTQYRVAKVWSNQDHAPISFAPAARKGATTQPVAVVDAPTVAGPSGALQMTLTAGNSIHAAGEPVTMTLTVTNPRPAPVTLAFAWSQQYDFEVRLGPKTLWRWSTDRVFAQALTHRVLGPSEKWVLTESWDGRDDEGQIMAPGSYEIVARLTTLEETPTASIPLLIGD